MSRRLVSRARSAVTVGSQTPAPRTEEPDISYEAPEFPLTDEAVGKLGELSRNRETLVYQAQIKESLRQLALAVYDVNNRLHAERARLEQMRTRRQERDTERTPEEDRLESHVASLERQVDALSRSCEQATRSAIDQRATLQDESAALGDLYTTASTAATTRRAQEEADARAAEAEDDDDAQRQPRSVAAPESTLDGWREASSRKKQEYEASSHYERYAVENDYIYFKKLFHDGIVGDNGPPLPDASRWFRDDGTPILSTSGNAGEEEDDDDVAVAREHITLNCPLTLQPLKEPYSNHKCKHTFEKNAILDYLSNSTAPMQCPQTGCVEMFSQRTFDKDFYLDRVILHRIQRVKQAEDANDMDVESDGGGDDELPSD